MQPVCLSFGLPADEKVPESQDNLEASGQTTPLGSVPLKTLVTEDDLSFIIIARHTPLGRDSIPQGGWRCKSYVQAQGKLAQKYITWP